MRIPKIENYHNDGKYTNIFIPKISSPDRTYHIMNEKDKVKLIKTVERTVRRSIEYKQYVQYLKNEIDMTMCTFFTKVSNKSNPKVSIEIHHEPFTLFDIVQTVVEKFISDEEDLNPFMIAEEVMLLHYKNMVGLVPLSITVHQLVHDGKLFIPLQNVYWDFTRFLTEYDPYISNDLRDALQIKLKMSKEATAVDTSILDTKFVYLDVEGFKLPQLVSKDD